MGVFIESAASVAWSTLPPIWPRIVSARGCVLRGIVRYSSIAVVAAVRHEQARPIGKRKARKIQREVANPSDKCGLPLLSVPFDTVHNTGLSMKVVVELASESGKVSVNALFGTAAVHVGLADLHIRRVHRSWSGIEFQIRMRLYPRSVTKSRVPSEVTLTGFSIF